MFINCFSVTFWFKVFKNHNDILEILQKEFNNEYQNFSIFNYQDNLVIPIISAINDKKMTNFSFSQINLQYNMDKVSFADFNEFKEKVLKLYEILTTYGIEVYHSALFINAEKKLDNSIKVITDKTLSAKINQDDLVDVSLKLGKKHEDIFYKIISFLNKNQINIPKKIDENGQMVPIPLISWTEASLESEIVEFSYEINDKYLFDHTKDYQTTEFYLNKMLYLLEHDFEDDINNLLEKGEF